jgi:osmoprotectant transport system permease protein
MSGFFDYFSSHLDIILQYTLQHLRIGMLAVSIAIVIGVPLGLLITKVKWLRKFSLGTASVMQAIPSLAFMGLLIPLVGIGDKTAIIIIAIYAVLPILRNTYTGLTNVDESTVEAARGIGMTESQVLFRVQFPMAMPVIMAGVRVAAVNSVSTATLAAFVGGGGLGKLIQAGIQIINTNMILSGAIPACLLALLMDYLFSRIEKAVVPISLRLTGATIDEKKIGQMKRQQKRTLAVTGLVFCLLIGSLVYDSVGRRKGEAAVMTIGNTGYIELRIVSQLYAQVIEEYTDVEVAINDEIGGFMLVWEAMKAGEIDASPSYTGTYYGTVLGGTIEKNLDADFIYASVDQGLDAYGISGAGQLGPNNQYVFAVTPETAEKYHLQKVSDLRSVAPQMKVGCSPNFYSRDVDGLFPCCQDYGLNFADALTFSAAPMYLALEAGEVDVIVTYRTDGLIQKYDLVFLEDDHEFFPPYVLFMMVSDEILDSHPDVLQACLMLEKNVSDEEMQDMNYRGAENGEDPYTIAHEFLVAKGLLGH